MFLRRRSCTKVLVLLCIQLVVAEWPSNFPNLSKIVLKDSPHNNSVSDNDRPSKIPSSTVPTEKDGMAPSLHATPLARNRLETQDVEATGGLPAGSDLHKSNDTEFGVAAIVSPSHLSFFSHLPTFFYNSTRRLDLTIQGSPRLQQLWAEIQRLKGESDFLQSPLLQSSLWPMAFLVITIGCFCCCLKRPIYCCGTQLCDYSHESATNHRQAMLLRQDAERGNESIKMTNIPLHNDVPQTNDNTATTKHDTPLGAIPQNKNPPPLDAKCKPKPTLSSVPSTLSLVKI